MYCPKCGHQNPDNANICESCDFPLTNLDTQQPKPKTSNLAIFSLVLGITSLFFFVITGIPAIIIAIVSYNIIKYSGGKLKGRPVSIASMILSTLFMGGFILLWSRDAPPIPNDYTIADLRSAPADCAESYELLRSLVYLFIDPQQEIENLNYLIAFEESITGQKSQMKLPEGFIDKYLRDDEYEPLISAEDSALINEVAEITEKGTASESSNILNKNADTIKQAWDKTQKARDIIHQLNEFPEIADLYEPGSTTQSLKILPLIHLSRLYQVYAHLQTEPDDIHNIATELIELDSVFRKLSLNARLLIMKLVCYTLLEKNILTANFLANNPETSRESIELLAEHFQPLTKEQLSLKNPVLFEYLIMKFAVSESPKETIIKVIPALKANSTLRLYRNYYDDLINTMEDDNDTSRERLAVWPAFYPFKEPAFPKKNERMPLLYRYYNPAGSILLIMLNSDIFETMPEQRTQIMVQNDLLQIVLNKRLGKEVDLKARAYSDEYIIDIENKIIFSPGPDGKAGTRDDIKLPINPEVLGLTE